MNQTLTASYDGFYSTLKPASRLYRSRLMKLDHHTRSFGSGSGSSVVKPANHLGSNPKSGPQALPKEVILSPRADHSLQFKRIGKCDASTDAQTDQIDWIVNTIAHLIEILSKLKATHATSPASRPARSKSIMIAPNNQRGQTKNLQSQQKTLNNAS